MGFWGFGGDNGAFHCKVPNTSKNTNSGGFSGSGNQNMTKLKVKNQYFDRGGARGGVG